MKETKKVLNVAKGALALGALSSANASLGGNNLVGGLAQGYGAALPAYGSIAGAKLSIDSMHMLEMKKKRR